MRQNRKLDRASYHAGEDVLLAYLDGEMQADERVAVELHLESCWTCRGRKEEISEQIKIFLQAREEILPPREVLENAPVEQFRARLERHAAESERGRSWMDVLTLALRRSYASVAAGISLHRRAALAVVTTVVLVAATLFDVFTTPLAAETVLLRTESYEAAHLPTAGHIRVSSVKVERINLAAGDGTVLGTFQLALDSVSQEVALGRDLHLAKQRLTAPAEPATDTSRLLQRIPVTAALPATMLAYLSAEHWLPEVSAREFRKVVEGRKNGITSTTKVGDELEIHYPFAAGHVSGITEAILRVDRATYAPREMSMRTAESGGSWEYRFTGQEQSLPERTAEWASVFSSPDLPAGVSAHGAAIPELVAVKALSYGQTSASAQEVQVAEVLHRLDTCLGEEVYVLPMSDGSLLIQGIVEQASRRDVLGKALSQLPFPVGIRLYVPSELSKNPALFGSPFEFGSGMASTVTAPATLADFSNRQTVIYGQLSKSFAQQGLSAEEANRKIAGVSNEIVTLSRQTLLHAWALRRLNNEFASRRTGGLTPETLQQIEQLRADHRKWISGLARQQTEVLAKFVEFSRVPDADPKSVSDQQLIELAGQLNTAVRSLFAVSGSGPGAESSLDQMVAVLHQLDHEAIP